MADVTFRDSSFKFVDPITKHKANSPLHHEVDNIPLCELEENTKWLKDQIAGVRITNIQRNDIAELKPYVNGEDNVVKVKPGRFVGRVNDAYNLTKLQLLEQFLGLALAEGNGWLAQPLNDVELQVIIDRFKEAQSNAALGLNGLVERVGTFPALNADSPDDNLLSLETTYQNETGLRKPPFPLQEVLLWAKETGRDNYAVRTLSFDEQFHGLPIAENHFIKYWRAVGRTAVVDIPEELSIEVPSFDPQDFFYVDETGQKQLLNAQNRIDLIFAYTKPVDSSSVTVAKFVNNAPQTITKVELGRVHGAGIGVDFRETGSINVDYNASSGTDSLGVVQMLPCVSDQFNEDNGFSGLNIHGSFPAPDDMMNLSPFLSEKIVENISNTHPTLVGQTVLPLAYIVVNVNDSVNANNKTILNDDNLVDIRPFFRTAELTYNERAGIAAAFPALSLANPAVGKAELDFQIKKHYDDLSAKFNSLSNTQGAPKEPRSVANGYVFGGALFGPEAALLEEIKASQGLTTVSYSAQTKGILAQRLSMDSNVTIPDYPDWDISKWCLEGNLASKGEFPNDYINFSLDTVATQGDYGAAVNNALTSRAIKLGTDNINGNIGNVCILFCKKTVQLDRTSVPWMRDYDVIVNYQNCLPLSCRLTGRDQDSMAGSTGVWVEKRPNEFTIYCAWVGPDIFQNGSEFPTLAGTLTPSTNRDDGQAFASFSVINSNITNGQDSIRQAVGEVPFGIAIYPTVSFNVIGIPNSFQGYYPGISRNSNTIKLF